MSLKVKTSFVALLALVAVTAYIFFAGLLFEAHRNAGRGNIEGLESASRLAPWNAEYHHLLGRAYSLGRMDASAGVRQYETSLALNRYSSRAWLDLASTHQMTGDLARQRNAMERAIAVSPTTPSVAWEVATFYLLQGDVNKALSHYRTVFTDQPAEARNLLPTLWTVTNGDTDAILDKGFPREPSLYLDFLKFTVERKDLDASAKIWQRLVALKSPFEVREAFSYFRLLIKLHHGNDAIAAWKQAALVNPNLAEYLPTSNNQIVNGDFEFTMLGGGLEWEVEKQNGVELRVDSLDFHGGNRSLAVTFDSNIPPTLGLRQYVVVEPSAEYQFSGFMKADGLDTASGPRFAIRDAYTQQPLFVSDEVRGSTAWKEFQGRFRTSPQAQLVTVEVLRSAPVGLIKGKLFVDDLSLRRN